MNGQKAYWDSKYKNNAPAKLKPDLWLDKRSELIKETGSMPVIELGCGRLFERWDIKYISECQMDRYRYPKILWEVVVKK